MPRGCLPHLQMLILLLLEKRGPLCGYRIARLLNQLGLSVDDASVYTVLQRLAERKLVELIEVERSGRRVKRYRLSERGREELNKLLEEYATLSKAVQALLESKS